MGRIIKEIEVAGDKGKATVKALFDTGASRSFIRWDVAEKVTTFLKAPTPQTFRMGDGQATMTVEYASVIYFTLYGYTFSDEFYIAPNLAHEFIVGSQTMQIWKMKLIPETEEIEIHPELLDMEL